MEAVDTRRLSGDSNPTCHPDKEDSGSDEYSGNASTIQDSIRISTVLVVPEIAGTNSIVDGGEKRQSMLALISNSRRTISASESTT